MLVLAHENVVLPLSSTCFLRKRQCHFFRASREKENLTINGKLEGKKQGRGHREKLVTDWIHGMGKKEGQPDLFQTPRQCRLNERAHLGTAYGPQVRGAHPAMNS